MQDNIQKQKINIFVQFFVNVGKYVQGFATNAGVCVVFGKKIVYFAMKKPYRINIFFQQLEFIGFQTFNVIWVSAMAVGGAFGLQVGGVFTIFGAESMIGAVTGESLCRELAPLVCLILVAGRVGSAMTAELATMKVNEQIEAMEAIGVNPIDYLVVPRVFAAIFTMPLLTAIFILFGVMASYISAFIFYDVSLGLFITKLLILVDMGDVMGGMGKSVVFAIIMSCICCWYGLHAKGGAKGVGLATTDSVIATILWVLIFDVVMTAISTFVLG